MITTYDKLEENNSLEADFCIIGGGPAAITIALLLKNTGKKIIILAGGDWSETAFNQDLHRGMVDPAGSHEPLEENRRRQFGGASTAWGGRCIPFEPIDFEKRDWIPYSGWPITYEDLKPYYVKAMEICKAGKFSFAAQEVFPETQKEIINNMDSELLTSDRLERWSTPVNFSIDYKLDLLNANNINVLLNAHVIALETQDASAISAVSAIAGTKKISVHATTFVLAAGGIENPRLLLASKNEFYPAGIGNNYDVVGRYYMGHLMGIHVSINPKDREHLLFDFELDSEGVYCRRRWWITEEGQKSAQIGNAIFYLHQSKNQEGHRDALFSAVFLAKSFSTIISQKSYKKSVKKIRELKPDIGDHLKNVLKNSISLAPQLYQLAVKRFSKRRLPFVLPSVKAEKLGLYFQTEQVPNPESRVLISDTEFDAIGLPRAIVRINFTEIDVKTVVESHKIFVEHFLNKQLGEVDFSRQELENFISESCKKFNSAAHHIGTTRMCDDPHLGVVDSNCKVHGTNNLYVAGASVFPTGGHANPTLTLVALAARLADHLSKTN